MEDEETLLRGEQGAEVEDGATECERRPDEGGGGEREGRPGEDLRNQALSL